MYVWAICLKPCGSVSFGCYLMWEKAFKLLFYIKTKEQNSPLFGRADRQLYTPMCFCRFHSILSLFSSKINMLSYYQKKKKKSHTLLTSGIGYVN